MVSVCRFVIINSAIIKVTSKGRLNSCLILSVWANGGLELESRGHAVAMGQNVHAANVQSKASTKQAKSFGSFDFFFMAHS